jgi:glycosyltransferase involved in cell wall biosynthesis
MISYIVPVYNGSASIEKCIQHLLYQRGEFDREYIIVNDGSTDNTVELVYKYPVNLFTRPHLGASATRNFGIAQAKGDFIVLVDADTRLDLNWTQRCLAEDPKTYDILCTNDLKTQEEDPAARLFMQQIDKNPYAGYQNMIGFIGNGNFIPARMKKFIQYDEMYIVGGEDTDLLLTLIEKGIRIKVTYGPSFLHRHMHRVKYIKYFAHIRKKVCFGYGGVRTWLKHPNSNYARRDAWNNLWVLPVYPLLWIYKKIVNLLIFI